VIDLSDSEDDDEQDIKDPLQQLQPYMEDQPWLNATDVARRATIIHLLLPSLLCLVINRLVLW
jgi:hypothetical protein